MTLAYQIVPVSDIRSRTVSVVGLGYVGLPMAAICAAHGFAVIGVDINEAAVVKVNQGQAHFAERDLEQCLSDVVGNGQMRAVTAPQPADIFLIAVPTPVKDDHTADMSAVEAAVDSIAPVLKTGDLVVIESTSPVGTTDDLARRLNRLRPDLTFPDTAPDNSDVMIAYCPERVLPGQSMRELIENARILGGLDRRSALSARAFYGTFVDGPLEVTTARVAELSKLSENAFRDVNIAFANELARVCEATDIDVRDVISLANLHPRVNILSPGPGVGGHCIPVDPWFIHAALPEATPLIRAARHVNDARPAQVAERIAKLATRQKEPSVALLGLAYKANVDDLRGSPAIEIARDLAARGIRVNVVEPHIAGLPPELAMLPGMELHDLATAVAQADVVAILVGHDAFGDLAAAGIDSKVVVDTVGLLRNGTRQ